MHASTQTAARADVAPNRAPAGAEIAHAARAATRRVAPLWPLDDFVAVNPYLGLADTPFEEAAGTLARAAGSPLTMPGRFYAEAIRCGRIADADLAAALATARPDAGAPNSVAELKALAETDDETTVEPALPTVADVGLGLDGFDWPALVTDRISAWAAAHFDAGQAFWRAPWRDRPAFAAWQAWAALDRTPDALGRRGVRARLAAMPDTAETALAEAVVRLGVPPAGLEAYFHRLLMTVGGWAALCRQRGWRAELSGGEDTSAVELLAIRACWDAAILEARGEGSALAAAWAEARGRLAAPGDTDLDERRRRVGLCILQSAYETAWRRALFARFDAAASAPSALAGEPPRKAVQAAFCIDVRSEPFRRALEGTSDAVETLGFAGFFGVPIELVLVGESRGRAQCPVLLRPSVVVPEGVAGAAPEEAAAIAGLRAVRRQAAKAWKAFKLAAVSSFSFVETMGLGYLVKLVTDGAGLTRPVPDPATHGLDADAAGRVRPCLEPGMLDGRETGLSPAARVDTAEAVLKAMSLTHGFARLVVLAGHGASTVNNPHASGLDCGACGGHGGDANARVVAAILNDADVRAGLRARGLEVPADTVFVPALHDTTTDDVRLFDLDALPASHADELARLRGWLADAGARTRAARAPALGVAPGAVDAGVRARARDWSQVRPEWGLAGCAAFVAAPRGRTAGLDLDGRAFLHSYDWRLDDGFGTLELILTAPMVVASWIALQYYGSTVDNATFGSGNKVLHNVTAGLGVLEGQGGDLRSGLPWQSLHDGERLVHEPMRLNVLVEAPEDAITGVLARHDEVRRLLDNGWVHLFRIDEDGRVRRRYAGGLRWAPVGGEPAAAA